MKKFIFTANLIALMALVPAVVIGYLHSDASKNEKARTEVVKEANHGQDDGASIYLVKTF